MKYASMAVLLAVVLVSSVSFILLSNSMGTHESSAQKPTYVPSTFLYIDYTSDVGKFLNGEISFKDLVKDFSTHYWIKGKVVDIAILSNASSAQTTRDCSGQYCGLSRLIFYFLVEDVIKGPSELAGKVIRVYDLLTAYEDGKILFVYDHLPLIPGKTYVLGVRPTDKLILTSSSPSGDTEVVILNHTTYVASTLTRFLVTDDGHVIYLYDRDAVYEADPDYADLMSKVSNPVVVTYKGNDPYLTGKATYDEFREWLKNMID